MTPATAELIETSDQQLAQLLPAEGILTTSELQQFAARVADRPELWRDRVHHDPARRHYDRLFLSDDVEIWVISWSAGHDTGFHDHDVSAAGLIVTDGVLVDERLGAFGKHIERVLSAGEQTSIEPVEIHRMHHPGGGPAVSLHAYSPPLQRMGAYEIGPEGQLLRHAQAGEDELEPVRNDD